MELEELYFTQSSLSRLVRQLRGDMSQREVAEQVGVAQSNVSEVENRPGVRPGTALTIIEELSDFRFEEEPRYKVRKHPRRDLSGETFESLAYHLRLLFYLSYRKCSLIDIQNEFPGYPSDESGPFVETEDFRIEVDPLCEGASMALQDLFVDQLVDFSTFDVYTLDKLRSRLRRKYQRMAEEDESVESRFSEEQIEVAVEYMVNRDPGVQPKDCWYIEDGSKVDLEGRGVYCSINMTEEGEKLVHEGFKNLNVKFRKEAINETVRVKE